MQAGSSVRQLRWHRLTRDRGIIQTMSPFTVDEPPDEFTVPEREAKCDHNAVDYRERLLPSGHEALRLKLQQLQTIVRVT